MNDVKECSRCHLPHGPLWPPKGVLLELWLPPFVQGESVEESKAKATSPRALGFICGAARSYVRSHRLTADTFNDLWSKGWEALFNAYQKFPGAFEEMEDEGFGAYAKAAVINAFRKNGRENRDRQERESLSGVRVQGDEGDGELGLRDDPHVVDDLPFDDQGDSKRDSIFCAYRLCDKGPHGGPVDLTPLWRAGSLRTDAEVCSPDCRRKRHQEGSQTGSASPTPAPQAIRDFPGAVAKDLKEIAERLNRPLSDEEKTVIAHHLTAAKWIEEQVWQEDEGRRVRAARLMTKPQARPRSGHLSLE